MVTFDQDGIATPESQAFVQEKVNTIVNDPSMTPAAKASKLRDLYNQYGLKQGTFERKGGAQKSFRQDATSSSNDDSKPSATGIILMVLLLLMLWFLGDIDKVLVHHFGFSIIKGIESFFQMLFS